MREEDKGKLQGELLWLENCVYCDIGGEKAQKGYEEATDFYSCW